MAMADTLLRNIRCLVTFDDDLGNQNDVDLLIRERRIEAVGRDLERPDGCQVIDASSLIVLPGLINAHNHLYQVGMRALHEYECATILPWLRGVHEHTLSLWRNGHFTPETVAAVARAGMIESLLGGVTTVADQHYVFPDGVTVPYIEAMIEAAHEVGIRLHAGRGTMTLGRRDGGAAPDETCQSIDEVLRHSAELIGAFHDPDPLARIHIDLAPCGVHVDRPEVFREFAALAESHPGVGLHTHLYEQVDTQFCRDHYDTTPWRILVENGWDQSRTWLAHMVDAPDVEIAEFAAARVGIVHLIAPDLRMGFGLAPIRKYLDAGCKVGFGTTGSASNDGCNQLGDLRLAALAHRIGIEHEDQWPRVSELLRMATRGSAECLNRPALGILAPGRAADLAAWELDRVDRVGVQDPVIGLVLTGLSDRAELVLVDGRIVVDGGRCVSFDERAAVAAARSAIPTSI